MKIDFQTNSYKNKLNKKIKLLLNINMKHFLIAIYLFPLLISYERLEISLIINSNGNMDILNDTFKFNPSEVIVNGIPKDSCSKTCYLENDENNVTIKFSNQINSCENMFSGLDRILEIDFSNFDFSKVINMDSMFNECTNLEKITFGNIDTSSVKTMKRLFHNCKKLTSIDLSNFDTSSVINMIEMFSHCESLESIDVSKFNTKKVENMCDIFAFCLKLTSINLSNFDTSKVLDMQGMFYSSYNLKYLDLSNFNTTLVKSLYGTFNGISSLIYINLFSFVINNDMNILDIFGSSCPNLKICINDSRTVSNLSSIYNCNFNCSDLCFKKNIKIDLKTNECIENCNESDYKYEYNNLCHEKCPNYTYTKENDYLCYDKKPEGYYLDLIDLKYKKCYNTCNNCYGYGNETNHNCIECKSNLLFLNDPLSNFPYNCYNKCPKDNSISDKYNCIFCTEEYPFESLSEQKCVKNCNIKGMIDKTCILNYKSNKTDENKIDDKKDIKDQDIILKNFENDFISGNYDTSNIDKGIDDIFENEKMTITLTTTLNQKNNTNNNMTVIDLGDCETLLKKENNIPEDGVLYIKKIDVYEKGMKTPKVEYDVYYKLSDNKIKKLDLSICKNTKVSIYLPVIIPENENIDKLNGSSGYYNDICYLTTSDEGTDISLKDRKNEFIEQNRTICQEDCDFSEYDKIIQKAKCDCKVNESPSSFELMIINKTKLYNNFIDIKNIANIKILKCGSVLFSKNGIISNIAFFIIVPVVLFHIISIIIFYYKQKKIIKNKIKDISFGISHWDLIKTENNNNIITQRIKKNNKKKSNKKLKNKKEDKKENKIRENAKEKSIKIKYNNPPSKNGKEIKIKFNNNYVNNLQFSNITKDDKKIKKVKLNDNEIIKKAKEIMEYNDEEMNDLSYKLALKYDKRNFCEFYLSLLKTKHILIFSFYNSNDYNSKIVKIDLFFICFILFYTVNALFFNDDTMHKIYEDQGSFNIIYQLPQIIYSSLISGVLNILLNFLALSESNILKLKKNKEKKNLNKRITELNNKLSIKFILYFILSFILLLLFWYYLCMFCAIYRNTQKHLIKDTLISFGLSLVYPFGIYLIPGIFRIPSLSNPLKKRKCLYNISQLFQMI